MIDANFPVESKPIKLVYIIGTYPVLTSTFIDREIATLKQLGNFEIQVLSLRYPRAGYQFSPEQKAACENTNYLIPSHWMQFKFLSFLLANLYYFFTCPLVYFQTFVYLISRFHPDFPSRIRTLFHFWQGVYATYRLRHHPFDHIHAHFVDRAVTIAFVISRFLKRPYSFTAHAADIYTRAVMVSEKIMNARFVITVSRYNKEFLIKTYPQIDPAKIYVLHPWVDISIFKPPSDRPVHPRCQILSVGRLVEKKGHLDLIDACHLLNEQGLDYETRIIGEGPLREELEGRIKRYGLQDRVHLAGGQPPDHVLELLRDWADIFTLPCVIAKDGDRDGMPVSLAEAMAVQLPVVSTDILGIPEIVKPGTGFLVPPNSPEALAEAIRCISAYDSPTRIAMGKRGSDVIIKEFNLVEGVKQLADLFRKSAQLNEPY